MKTIIRMFALMGFMSFLSFLSMIAFVFYMAERKPELPEQAILALDFAETLTPSQQAGGWRHLLEGNSISVMDYADTIRRAADDDRIKGLYANVSFVEADLAMLEEIRAAIAYFRSKDKWTVAFADTMGEGGNAMGVYFLATAFDEIWLQPTGGLSLMGIGVEMPFFKDTLAKVGLEADFGRRHEFKTAMNNLTETGFTEAHREETLSLINGLYQNLQQTIDTARPSAGGVDAVLAQSPLTAEQASKAGLINGMTYERDLLEGLAKRVWGEQTTLQDSDGWVDIHSYRQYWTRAALKTKNERPALALVQIIGPILRQVDDEGFGTAEDMADAQKIAQALIAAADDKTIKAILVRVDSPGGSYVASDTIRSALLYAKQKKPLVVSMGSYAASGGYYVAMDGHEVFANAMTITGSIGVFGGKLVAADLMQEIGARVERLGIGERAFMWSPTSRFNETERQAFEAMLDSVYDDFTAKVAEARAVENIDALARGRVWTGEQAVAGKLADSIGTYHDALTATKVKAGLAGDAEVDIIVYPAPENPIDALLGMLSVYQPALALVSRLAMWVQLASRADATMLLPFSQPTF